MSKTSILLICTLFIIFANTALAKDNYESQKEKILEQAIAVEQISLEIKKLADSLFKGNHSKEVSDLNEEIDKSIKVIRETKQEILSDFCRNSNHDFESICLINRLAFVAAINEVNKKSMQDIAKIYQKK